MTLSDVALPAASLEPASNLWLFFLLVLGIVLLPGLDMAYILASTMGGGRRAGLAAVGGITAGGVVHVTVGALGLAAILALVPAAFNAVLIAGALYVAWIGWGLARHGVELAPSDSGDASPAGDRRSRWQAFRRGALTNLLNPKAYVFMLAVFPQFVSPARPIAGQAIVLGTIITLTQLVVYGAIVLAASAVRGWLTTRPAVLLAVGRTIGVTLIAAAAFTGLTGWRTSAAAATGPAAVSNLEPAPTEVAQTAAARRVDRPTSLRRPAYGPASAVVWARRAA